MSEHLASRPDVELVPGGEVMRRVDLAVETPVGDDPDVRLDLFDPRIEHRVRLIERGPFAVAVCRGCGWESFARRSRPLAREEGLDHEALFRSG